MSVSPHQSLFDSQRNHFFQVLKNSTLDTRRAKLHALRKWVLSHQDEICAAAFEDRGKHEVATLATEVNPVLGEINHVRRHLADWMRPRRVPTPIRLLGGTSWISTEPKGVCLLLAPWNFPFLLSLTPLISAVAAGNAVVLKPSEKTPATSALVQRMAAELFSPEEVTVLLGGVDLATELLELPWNHIFFTGSGPVGKIVMHAAAENMSGVTLELGGANPAIVDETADLRDAAIKLVWGRFFNDGASCVSPNHIFVHESVHDRFVREMARVMRGFYGDLSKSKDIGRMINGRHWDRMEVLLRKALEEGGQIAEGGIRERERLLFSPTLLTGLDRDSMLVTEETFGPLMPVVKYVDLLELLEWQRQREIPLAIYLFSKRGERRRQVMGMTQSGTVGMNQTTLQFPQMELPFGGQNASGFGKAHGHAGFMAFSNERSVFRDPPRIFMTRLFHPPYNGWKSRLIRWANRYL